MNRVSNFFRTAALTAAVVFVCAGAKPVKPAAPVESALQRAQAGLERVNVKAATLAVEDLATTWPEQYDAVKHRAALAAFTQRRDAVLEALKKGDAAAVAEAERLTAGVRAALLANPLLDNDRLLLVRRNIGSAARKDMKGKLGFISLNSHCHVTIGRKGWDNEIAVLSNLRGTPQMKTLYKPKGDEMVRDLDLDFSGKRLLFSSFDANRKWGVFEVAADGSGFKQVTPTAYPDVDWFDGCYLPDGRIILLSTASYQGLPCEGGSRPMAQIYQIDPETKAVRQLTFEQDSDYTPSIMNDGRILYTRWEYSDLPHYFTRIIMAMNPDGTSQLSQWGSGSYYPTAIFQARAIPGDPNKFVAIVGGHHDLSEIGRLIVVDPSLARRYPFKYKPTGKEWGKAGDPLRIATEVLPAEQTGILQEIPGYGKSAEGDVCDNQVANQFQRGRPYFIHPWPLGEAKTGRGAGHYFLVSAKPSPDALWGIYLVDIFDNLTLLAEVEDAALFEPMPLQARPRPPTLPDRITPGKTTATVHIADIYSGPGLKGIPRGKAKALRVFAYHYNYLKTGGHASLGVESAWDIKRILGTVPVEEDGSVCFEIPANTPVSLQPLDADGAALQLMRSWLVGMPGERVSCLGCHEDNRSSVPAGRAMADRKPVQQLQPWHGAARPFSFEFEVYPTVQKDCVGCHSGATAPPRLADQGGAGRKDRIQMNDAKQAYAALHPYVRRPGPESELEMYPAMEYHVSTSPLVQMLKKGHHGVQLDREAWERLEAWIDLNVPYKAKWDPKEFESFGQKARRLMLGKIFANIKSCPEDEYDSVAAEAAKHPAPAFVSPAAVAAPVPDALKAAGFPFDAAAAASAQKALGEIRKTVVLPGGLKMTFVRIPAGEFVMGSLDGAADERPRAVVRIAKPFWMSECEVRNAEFACFDPVHDTRYIDQHGKDHNMPGFIANHPDQPVARVPWTQAMAFCAWLNRTAKVQANLPTEAQWEWAARTGSAKPFFFGGLDDDFSPWANLADRSLRWFRIGYAGGGKISKRSPYNPEMNFPLHEERFEDKWFIVDYVGQCQANPWGLKDVIGNVSEWTRSSYRPYPYRDDDGRNAGDAAERKVARGGSWASRPREATSSVRLAYEAYQSVHDVGFRVILEE